MNIDSYPILDEVLSRGSHFYGYAVVVDIAGRRVRAKVERDGDEQHSVAAAHILADDMTWTLLAASSAHSWFDHTPSPRDPRLTIATALCPIARRLLDRTAAILGEQRNSTVDF
jgi:hypothetical protein